MGRSVIFSGNGILTRAALLLFGSSRICARLPDLLPRLRGRFRFLRDLFRRPPLPPWRFDSLRRMHPLLTIVRSHRRPRLLQEIMVILRLTNCVIFVKEEATQAEIRRRDGCGWAEWQLRHGGRHGYSGNLARNRSRAMDDAVDDSDVLHCNREERRRAGGLCRIVGNCEGARRIVGSSIEGPPGRHA